MLELASQALSNMLTDSPRLTARLVDIDLSILFMLGLFLLFTLVVTKLIARPAIEAQTKRYASMDGAQEAAADAELKAAEFRLSYEKQLTEARQAAVGVRDGIRDEAAAAAAKLIAEVRSETEAKVAEGQAKLNASAEAARREMSAQAQELSELVAKKIMLHGGS